MSCVSGLGRYGAVLIDPVVRKDEAYEQQKEHDPENFDPAAGILHDVCCLVGYAGTGSQPIGGSFHLCHSGKGWLYSGEKEQRTVPSDDGGDEENRTTFPDKAA